MNTAARIAVMLAAGIVLPAIGVAPQLQARLTGKEYAVRVAPVDPIDPFRGAYVDLTYPDLRRPESSLPAGDVPPNYGMGEMDDEHSGDVFITITKQGEVWVADRYLRQRPEDGPYLACTDLEWRIRCGIESWFLPQDKARDLERKVAEDGALATIKVDSRGHAALVGIE